MSTSSSMSSSSAATNVSRRGFLKGTAAGAAGLGIASLTGTAFAEEAASAEADAETEAAPAEEAAEPQGINPQDYSYTTNSISDFTQTTLFSDWQLGSHTLHHRMMRPGLAVQPAIIIQLL